MEHLLAALRGMGVDNVRVDLEGNEVPIMDGSAASFVYLLRMAGIEELSAPRRVLALTKPVEYVREGKYIKARPYNGFKVDYTIDFSHPLIGQQSMSFTLTGERFAEKLAKARTFGFLKEVEYLHQNGLALGGSLENAVVLDEFGVLNEDGLRFEDEFVRHKVLDFIGDMAVSEYPLFGHFEVFASGHGLNNEFLRYLTENADEYLEKMTLGSRRSVSHRPQCDRGPCSAASGCRRHDLKLTTAGSLGVRELQPGRPLKLEGFIRRKAVLGRPFCVAEEPLFSGGWQSRL